MSTVPAIPVIGSSGYFKLRSPFDSKMIEGERYTCKSLRKISDYLADRKDIFTNIYKNNGLSEEDFNRDQLNDTVIVGLQSGIGHWIYVPVNYIVSFPDINGVPYRGIGFMVALPPIPMDKDLDYVSEEIKNVVKDNLGVDAEINLVELSKPVLIPVEKHDEVQLERDMNVVSGTDRSRLMAALKDNDTLRMKVKELEEYIKKMKGL